MANFNLKLLAVLCFCINKKYSGDSRFPLKLSYLRGGYAFGKGMHTQLNNNTWHVTKRKRGNKIRRMKMKPLYNIKFLLIVFLFKQIAFADNIYLLIFFIVLYN